jgi:spectinomycin phosphotransferase
VTFTPLGYAETACYLVDAGGGRYFLKLWPRMQTEGPAAARRLTTLRLMRALAGRDVSFHVPPPLETKQGALRTALDGAPAALFPFVAGAHPSELWPIALAEELARAIATLHRATPDFAGFPLPRETFEVPVDAVLRHLIEIAAQAADATPAQAAAQRWVRERGGDVLVQLERLRVLKIAVRGGDGPRVLCHTDLHHNNLLVDDQGHLWLLDWDDAAFAPPEHDLWSGLGVGARSPHFEAFMAAYQTAGEDPPLHLDRFAFYLLRRYLNDAAEDFSRLLNEESAGDESETDLLLHSLDECADRWSRLDATLATIAAAL